MPSMISIYSYVVMKSRKKIKKNAGRLNPHYHPGGGGSNEPPPRQILERKKQNFNPCKALFGADFPICHETKVNNF
jgi:hypothetical protein